MSPLVTAYNNRSRVLEY